MDEVDGWLKEHELHVGQSIVDSLRPNGIRIGHLEDYEKKDLDWLLKGFLLAGEFTILQGHGGTSKGTLAASWAAMVSRGKTEPPREPQCVLWASAEDNIGSVVRPRLEVVNADTEMVKPVFYWQDGMREGIVIPDHVRELQDLVSGMDVGLVIIDPLMSHLSSELNANDDKEVKLALRPLVEMAHATGCAVLAIHHLTKDTSRGAFLSGQGSGAFGNTARIVLAIAEDDEDDDLRLLEVVKTNVSKKGLTMELRMERVQLEGLEELVPRVVRTHRPSDKSVHGLLAKFAKKKREQMPGVF